MNNCKIVYLAVFLLFCVDTFAIKDGFEIDLTGGTTTAPAVVASSDIHEKDKKSNKPNADNDRTLVDDEDYNKIFSSGNGRSYDDFEHPDEILGDLKQLCVDKTFKSKMSCLKGEQGQPGPKGEVGLPGPVGPEGVCPVETIGRKGDAGPIGPKGETGEQGISIKGDKGRKGEKGDGAEHIVHGRQGPPGRKGSPGLSSAFVYNNRAEIRKIEKYSRPGSIAYVRSEKKFYGRVPEGWAPFLMGEPIERQEASKKEYPWIGYKAYNPRHRRMSHIMERILAPKPKVSTLRLVALNNPWTGNMNGIDFINYECQKEAYEAGVNGFYRAFLSSKVMDLKFVVKNPKDVIVNLMNQTMYKSWNDVFNRKVNFFKTDKRPAAGTGDPNTYIYSFDGKNVIGDEHWEENLVWHGTFSDGRSSNSRSCKFWTTNNSTVSGRAADFLDKYMIDQQNQGCDSKLIVLCIELPSYLMKQYEIEVLGLAEGTEKLIHLNPEEHKLVLDKYDQDWAHFTNSRKF